jgi:mersacidin/lichenicidin family type 2 lantibiotic
MGRGVNIMSNNTLIRAWKDEEYRDSLGEVESPVGAIELTDSDLDQVSGNGVSCFLYTLILVICKKFSVVCLASAVAE